MANFIEANMRFVRVTWLDARDGDGSWSDQADAQAFGEKDCEVISMGFVVHDTIKYLTLAADFIADDRAWGRVMKIPKGMITEVKDVSLA